VRSVTVTVTACATGWPVTVGVVEVGVVDTRYGRGARVYTAHRSWLGVVTGISAASTGGVLTRYAAAQQVLKASGIVNEEGQDSIPVKSEPLSLLQKLSQLILPEKKFAHMVQILRMKASGEMVEIYKHIYSPTR